MADRVASDIKNSAAAGAPVRVGLAALDDALLTLLAKRLAHALLLDGNDTIYPGLPDPDPTPVDSGSTDPHP